MSGYIDTDAWEFLGTRPATQEDIDFYDMLQSHIQSGTLDRPELAVGDKLAEIKSEGLGEAPSIRTLTGPEVRSYFHAATENSKGYQIPALKQAAQAMGLNLNLA